jgi:hypothetical protein
MEKNVKSNSKSTKLRDIIAVGYNVPTSGIMDSLVKAVPNLFEIPNIIFTKDSIPEVIKSGVLYSNKCQGGHQANILSNQQTMDRWFTKRSNTTNLGYCKKIYYRNDSIVADVYSDLGDTFYVVLFYTGPTTQVKHAICNGTYNNQKQKGVQVNIERITIDLIPYIYREGDK